jgi:hypothetical protein
MAYLVALGVGVPTGITYGVVPQLLGPFGHGLGVGRPDGSNIRMDVSVF